MAWYQPLERKDGGFDYTCTNGAGTFPIGFCMSLGARPFYSLPYSDISDVVKGLYRDEAHWEAEKTKYAAHLHRYHDHGHATAEEASACYRLFEVLLHSRRRTDESVQLKCGTCGNWTQSRVLVGSEIPYEYAVCTTCDTEDNILRLHTSRWHKG